ncbi:hypothetical protein SEA_OTTAWA_32 [Arthrobacter phage Ottawa]|nr:hypothetical protein SEA_KHARCHO_32 [Arthrobacter phage Kharcho]WIC89264.1 hypothetical protein SEA_OTTAWA_32 [Arthrobacter phage Ottawa]
MTTIEVSIIRKTKNSIHCVLVRPEGFTMPTRAIEGVMLAEIARSLGIKPAETPWRPVRDAKQVEPTSVSMMFEPITPVIRYGADGTATIPINALRNLRD